MMVKEKNGEVSASVDETNRVRALLGLKPLQGTAKPAAAAAAPPTAPGVGVAGPAPPPPGAAAAASERLPKRPKEPAADVGPAAVLALDISKYSARGAVRWESK